MKIKDLILSLIVFILSCSNMRMPLAKAYELESSEKILLAYAEVCSCRDHYGVPHTCYFSPYTDPFNSCFAKCLYEAGN